MMKIYLILIVLMLLPLMSAEIQDIGNVKQGDCITLRQSYFNSTYTNLTSITYPNDVVESQTIIMTKNGANYNYSFCNTTLLGLYEYCTLTDVDGEPTSVCLNFDVTPQGNDGTNNIMLYVLIILVLYGINLFGFFGKNIPMTILGGMALIGLGLYTITNGLIIYRDWMTNYFAYVTIAWGAISSLWAIIEQLDIF